MRFQFLKKEKRGDQEKLEKYSRRVIRKSR
jgi:hypothetical protein